jgi:hypothetical protein
MAGRPKGYGKTGGKPKGYTSEPVKKATELFVSILEGQVDHIKDAFDDVREKDKAKYLELYAKYAQYFIPRKTEVDNTHKFDSPAIIDWTKPSEGNEKSNKTP